MNDWPALLGVPLWGWLFVLPSLLALAAALAGERAARPLAPLWRTLDAVYLAAGVVAAGFLVLILFLIVAQMVARWSSLAFPGSTEFAGYSMAGASFFALAHALTRGAHIRVSIFLNLNALTRRWLDVLALWVGAIIATYFARFALKAAGFSAMLNDRTQGQDKMPDWLIAALSLDWAGVSAEGWSYTPVWIPQIVMVAGAGLLAIALWDMLVRTLVLGRPLIVSEAME
ncbi:TRAP transporter small permease [Jannaschia sp. W003]|uniref:TRAP transporter small permease n=1 Tax=Jannaschia sp. W003 TaxID=2867012 RepID=UPI0021A58FDF|nr:TRAP transporter small permease [Jannaschia sp. W003]UWQ22004.1 TRAP transporter small permease [Jannaschia sp. W003]